VFWWIIIIIITLLLWGLVTLTLTFDLLISTYHRDLDALYETVIPNLWTSYSLPFLNYKLRCYTQRYDDFVTLIFDFNRKSVSMRYSLWTTVQQYCMAIRSWIIAHCLPELCEVWWPWSLTPWIRMNYTGYSSQRKPVYHIFFCSCVGADKVETDGHTDRQRATLIRLMSLLYAAGA